ncbi:Sperm-associated antigen 16 protein, partial [Gonapodya sp. JEL0774]
MTSSPTRGGNKNGMVTAAVHGQTRDLGSLSRLALQRHSDTTGDIKGTVGNAIDPSVSQWNQESTQKNAAHWLASGAMKARNGVTPSWVSAVEQTTAPTATATATAILGKGALTKVSHKDWKRRPKEAGPGGVVHGKGKPGSATSSTGDSDVQKTFVLEKLPATNTLIPSDSDSDDSISYEEIPLEDFLDDPALDADDGLNATGAASTGKDKDLDDEDLEAVLRNLNEKSVVGALPAPHTTTTQPADTPYTLTRVPEVVDDYVRNFLARRGMKKTLNMFQTEWYDLHHLPTSTNPAASTDGPTGPSLTPLDTEVVPSVYIQLERLREELERWRERARERGEVADRALATFSRLRHSRHHHRMHHRRVLQEKSLVASKLTATTRALEECKRESDMWKRKCEERTREVAVVGAERDRVRGMLERAGVGAGSGQSGQGKGTAGMAGGLPTGQGKEGAKKAAGQAAKGKGSSTVPQPKPSSAKDKDKDPNSSKPTPTTTSTTPPTLPRPRATFPATDVPLVYTRPLRSIPTASTGTTTFAECASVNACAGPVGGMVYHPRTDMVATWGASWDGHGEGDGWTVWGVRENQAQDRDGYGCEMARAVEGGRGEGVTGVAVGGGTPYLATSHRSGAVKIWNLSASTDSDPVLATLRHRPAAGTGGAGAATCVAWHAAGEMMASGGMDGVVRVWDVGSSALHIALSPATHPITSCAFHPSSTLLLTTTSSGTGVVQVYDPRVPIVVRTLKVDASAGGREVSDGDLAAVWSWDGKRVAVAGRL